MALSFALSPVADHHRPCHFCRPSPLYSSSFGEESPHHHQQQPPQAHAMRWVARAAPFTVVQYEELEHQALIYKYLVAGIPVPSDLLLPIRHGFDSLASRFYHLPSLAGWIRSPKTIYLPARRWTTTCGRSTPYATTSSWPSRCNVHVKYCSKNR